MSRRLSLKIGVSGVRGIIGESLTPQLVTSFAAAFGTYAGTGPILVGTDTRPSRVMVKNAVMSGLLSVGCTPIDAGILPIPALQHHVPKAGAFGGICITASHNPIEWNALKFFGPDGILLRPNQALELTNLYHQGVYPRIGSDQMADVRTDESAIQSHRDAVLAAADVEAIRKRRFKVAVDCVNGAASHATPAFLFALGCEVVPIYTDPDATFPHPPEPLPENLGDLCAMVRGSGADIGFAQDADADRLAVIDENGIPLGEDSTVTLAIRHYLKRNPGPVVVNVSTSRMVDDVAAEFGVPVYRSSVGEINVVEAMLAHGAKVGGEGNGGVICSAINPCRDSYVAMALLLEALAEEGGTIRQMRERVPSYAIVKEKLLCPARGIAPALRKLQSLYHDAEFDLTDGLKAVWPDRWLSARASNTEPIIRLTAEAPTESDARALMHSALECLSPSA
jgi:phosphomannomutase